MLPPKTKNKIYQVRNEMTFENIIKFSIIENENRLALL